MPELERAARAVPYQRLPDTLFPGVEAWIRRDDLLDPLISGNKAYKLLFNLVEARRQGAEKIITCGGAWSNHIHALAAAGRRFGFATVGIIRGERPAQLSAMLQDAERFGMELRFVSRDLYRRRGESEFIEQVGIEMNRTYFVPEGGANLAGARGAQFLGRIITETAPTPFDQVWLACGTGLTLSGVQAGLAVIPAVGVPVLKAGRSIYAQAGHWLRSLGVAVKHEPLCEGYECGGYARINPELSRFLHHFKQTSSIPLDPVYTAKLVFALYSESRIGKITIQSKVLLLHSGGLQGRRGLLPADNDIRDTLGQII
ncbi:D-cysteine desulfhydrase [Microbulbifer aestuariivivens]|uniref:D-cysteine desulfhydrase n=1 Tax=Microbulbifer aestuariivivens TaxID=1908308 RepID=A0ABP9WUX9_9GAMM